MQCGSCQAENAETARFCADCGQPLSLSCPSCDAAVRAAQKFCAECGASLTTIHAAGAELSGVLATYTPVHLAQRILATRHSMRGEKKQVTVLFCDLVESTALAHAIGAEAMHELLSEFFTRALEQVHHFEGTVNQFLGDGFMAIFGAPLAYEDHAARAALAALAIREATAALRSSTALPGADRVQVRIGMNSGQVVVGAIGDDLRMDYTASGDTTNVAARLQSVAVPGEILCGESTVLAAREAIQVEALGAVTAKGVAEPLQRYRLVQARALTSRLAHRRTTLVGREVELAQLRKAFDQIGTARGQVIEIVGEPGVGKSRLILELAETLAARARVVTANCITYGSQAPNAPIAGIVRGLCQVTAADDPAAQLSSIAKSVAAERGDDVNYLGALFGLTEAIERLRQVDPATARGRTTSALTALIRGAAAQGSLVLIVEDLHWVDASSMDYLSAIATAMVSSGGLLVVTLRPGSEPKWGMGSAIRIPLRPLIPMDGRTLVQRLTGDAALSEQQVEHVIARGEGNPLFIEELVRSVRHGSDAIPGDLLAVLGARIDRLDPQDKTLLNVAATLGREFALALVEDIAALDERSRTRIDRLIALGFVEPGASAGLFSFVHALTQEVAYTNMLSPDRRRLHTAIAERVAASAPSPAQVCEEVARHHLLGNTRNQAIPFLELAIGKALQAHALDAANGFFKDALALLEAEPETAALIARRVGLVLQQFPAFHFTHRHREYMAVMERYRPLAEATEAPALLGPFYAGLGHRLWTFGRFDEARQILEQASQLCKAAGDHPNAAHAELMLGWVYGYAGDFAGGERHGLAAIEHFKIVPIPFLQAMMYVGLMLNHIYRGQWQQAAECAGLARDVGVAAGDDGVASFGGAFCAYAACAHGDYAAAITHAERALAVAPTDYFRGWAYAYLASALCYLGQAERGAPILEQACALARASGHIGGYSEIAPLLIDARIRVGQFDRARELATELGEQARAFGRPYITGITELALGELDLRARDADAALARFQYAAKEFDRIGARHKYAQALFGLGRTHAVQGAIPAARGTLQDALVIFRELRSLGVPEEVEATLSGLRG